MTHTNMPITLMPRRPKTPTGPRPSDEAVNAFVEFFEAADLTTAKVRFY